MFADMVAELVEQQLDLYLGLLAPVQGRGAGTIYIISKRTGKEPDAEMYPAFSMPRQGGSHLKKAESVPVEEVHTQEFLDMIAPLCYQI